MKKLLCGLVAVLALSSNAALALDQDVEIDILMNQVTTLLKANKSAEVLPLFEQLEGMNAKLPESFDYYYLETLDKAGRGAKALERGEGYLRKYGKKGKYYGQAIEIVSRRKTEADAVKAMTAVSKAAEQRLADPKVVRAMSADARLVGELVGIPHRTPFLLGKTEVTQQQWRALMGGDPAKLRSKHEGCDDCAVTDVSWHDVKEFIAKLNARTQGGYRLPSEVEWEFACRAGEKQEYCGSDSVGEVAWYDGNSDDKVHPVGQKKVNAWGLYDMSGNVWEWTEDCYDGNCGRRVVRGSSWLLTADNARASYRYYLDAGDRYSSNGFRLARTLP